MQNHKIWNVMIFWIVVAAAFGVIWVLAKLDARDCRNGRKPVSRNGRIPVQNSGIKRSPKFLLSTDVAAGTCKPTTVNQVEAKRLIEMLLDIHTPKIPFQLRVSDKKPKTRMGIYSSNGYKITIYRGWISNNPSEETAIHELAHHIHLTENGGRARKERPHGKEFKKVYNQLLEIAKDRGYLRR